MDDCSLLRFSLDPCSDFGTSFGGFGEEAHRPTRSLDKDTDPLWLYDRCHDDGHEDYDIDHNGNYQKHEGKNWGWWFDMIVVPTLRGP